MFTLVNEILDKPGIQIMDAPWRLKRLSDYRRPQCSFLVSFELTRLRGLPYNG